MTLSFVIVNLNTKVLLMDCIASIYDTVNLPFEIFLVDNASTDDSVLSVRESYPEVRIIENNLNLGFAAANNQALRLATGDYIVLLNTDTVLTENAIAALADYMEQNSNTGICGAQLLNDDDTLQNSIASTPDLLTELTNKSLLRRLMPGKYMGKESVFVEPTTVDSLIGACLMVRKSAMDEVGFLDEDFFFFLEETDWCIRFARAGWVVVFNPNARVYHLQGQTAQKVHIKARIEYWRSRYIFFSKHRGLMAMIILRIGLIIRLLLNLIFYGVISALTFGVVERSRMKFLLYVSIALWHLRLCTDNMGLRPRELDAR